jgi:SAM-dependent methyltransferase
VERTLVTAAEVARLAGVGRAAVSNWRRRYPDFPRPAGGSETSPAFRLADIQNWLREQGRLGSQSGRELAWHQLDESAEGGPVADVLASAGRYLAGAGAHSQIDDALRRALDELARDAGREEAYEGLLRRYVEAHSRQLATTSSELAALMVELADATSGSVLDPACGTGTVLRAVPDDVGVLGQEIDPGLAALAAARLAFRAGPAEVRVGDSIRDDAFAGTTVDALVCNPPFNVRSWGFEDLQYDGRWVYGLPPKGESELAWVQHCLAHLSPRGRAVLVMPPSVASRRSGRPIRAELLRRGALRAIIAMPAGAAPPVNLPMHLWVFEQPDAGLAADGLLLVDTTAGTSRRLDELGWSTVAERVRAAWQGHPLSGVSAESVYRVVPTIDLLDDEVDLAPGRRLRPDLDIADIESVRKRLLDLVGGLPRLLPEIAPVREETHRASVTLGELARSGALLVRQQVGRWEIGNEGAGTPVLTARDVVTGSAPSGRLASAADEPLDVARVRPGDVVVPVVAPRPTAVVIEEGGALLGPNIHLVRPDPEQIDPWFLAGFLQSSEAMRTASSMSGMHRFDVRRVEVPRLPLEEQRRYGDTFRRIAAFARALDEAAALGREVTQSLVDGVAAGVLEPPRNS